MDYTVQIDIVPALSRLQAQNRKMYTYIDIAELSGLTRQTVRNVLLNPPKQINVSTLAGFLKFFAVEGMPVTLNDLIAVTVTSTDPPSR